jgi:hypothetical protein
MPDPETPDFDHIARKANDRSIQCSPVQQQRRRDHEIPPAGAQGGRRRAPAHRSPMNPVSLIKALFSEEEVRTQNESYLSRETAPPFSRK